MFLTRFNCSILPSGVFPSIASPGRLPRDFSVNRPFGSAASQWTSLRFIGWANIAATPRCAGEDFAGFPWHTGLYGSMNGDESSTELNPGNLLTRQP